MVDKTRIVPYKRSPFTIYLCKITSLEAGGHLCTASNEASGKEKAEVSCEVGSKPGAKAATLR